MGNADALYRRVGVPSVTWWNDALARNGPVGFGLGVGTLAKQGLVLSDGGSISWKSLLADVLLPGMLGVIAVYVADYFHLTGDASVLMGRSPRFRPIGSSAWHGSGSNSESRKAARKASQRKSTSCPLRGSRRSSGAGRPRKVKSLSRCSANSTDRPANEPRRVRDESAGPEAERRGPRVQPAHLNL